VIVTAPTPKEAEDIYAARSVLEGLTAQLCARRATKDDIVDLRADLANIQSVLRRADATTAEMLVAKARFYATMFRIADNPTVVGLLAPLQAKISVLRATSMSRPGRPKAVVKEIRAVVDAIARHDEAAAFAACATHVQHAAQAAAQLLSAQAAAALASATG
jgi:DNA-binding GntR family transcriptional regulator